MTHQCRIASCTRPAKDGQLMCWPHWRGLPRALKDAIFETFANGPRDAYRANVEQAVALVDQREGRTPQQGTEEQPWCDPMPETPMEGPQ